MVLFLAALCLTVRPGFGAEAGVLDAMDAVGFAPPKEKASLSLVEGKRNKAVRFAFADENRGVFVIGKVKGTPEWDRAAGFSFWVKGDGSGRLGGIEFLWNGDYGARYAYAFPIDSTEWKKIVVPWRDLIPELSKPLPPIDPKSGSAPSKLGPITFGKWWYWGDYGAHAYAIDDLRLEPSIPSDTNDYRPAGAPLARVLAKLKAGKPVTIVTMGDSLTDVRHWTNRTTNWPAFLKTALSAKFRSEITLVNPALGGTELRHNLVLLPRWARREHPSPDLVTVFFGFNDWNAGMRGPEFLRAQADAIDRVRRATGGKADVLVLTTCPPLENGEAIAELAAACRQAARQKNAGLADVYAAFQSVAGSGRAPLFADDKVHLGRAGQELVARTVQAAIENGGR